ncbi:MAG: sulfide/dihydroorotate dehydrogenase-like FAD/NAD-binding protein [Candidatus Omnitrophica bacterium]|nr:sulfide/dihydroorotate dehydrogenase-like FAD/NAD-binding protein [Candidatus Omnitrophota bacterium]
MEILEKSVLMDTGGTRVTKIVVRVPLVAPKAEPGQFVVVMVEESGERIPLTVVDTDKQKGTITLIFQELGFTTKLLGKLNTGDDIYAIAGPLGHAMEIKKYGKVILVGGGVGIAEIYPVARALKNVGNHVTTILGARAKNLLILEQELKSVSDELHVATDDGSYGKKGFTTDILKELLTNDSKPSAYSLIYAVGPIPMMAKVSLTSKPYGVKTLVSLNALMVDGTGMCGCCRVTVNKKVQFSCIDGPEFDGNLVNWEELQNRSKIYCKKEDHICRLEKT